MKKLDLHVHTIATAVDVDFEFDLPMLQSYVNSMGIDGIAITNHNMFDLEQYRTIANALAITVLPGIEINLGQGHAIVVADTSAVKDFAAKCSKVEAILKTHSDTIDVGGLTAIFGDLSKYLILPHYDKKPPVDELTLGELSTHFIAGEVSSAKKFMYAKKNQNSPTPVLASDSRAKVDWEFKSRHTFFDISDINVRSIKAALSDKNRVSLSKIDGNELIEVTPEGISISSGLTVVLGGRSSGKSHTLDKIYEFNDDVRYIRQFELIERDPKKEAKKFIEGIGKKQRDNSDKYLKSFRDVVDEVKNISLRNDEKKIEEYVESLLKSARQTELEDAYSNTALFNEALFTIKEDDNITELIDAVRTLLKPGKEYESIIDARLPRNDLEGLITDLIDAYRKKTLKQVQLEWVNEVVGGIKHNLSSVSAVTAVTDIDFLQIARNIKKVEKFNALVKEIQKPRIVADKKVQRFTIVQSSEPIEFARDLGEISEQKISFKEAFSYYGNPYDFLCALKEIDSIDPTSYYMYFTKIDFKILNEYGVPVSGGERAEFRLINEIERAANYDILLIDEPESSFDNIFLSSDVNQTIKEIAQNTPVVVVTHNNTVGASIKPDYVIHTKRIVDGGEPVYKIYSGRSTDKELVAVDGETTSNLEVTLKYLEAGKDNYNERGEIYEALKD